LTHPNNKRGFSRGRLQLRSVTCAIETALSPNRQSTPSSPSHLHNLTRPRPARALDHHHHPHIAPHIARTWSPRLIQPPPSNAHCRIERPPFLPRSTRAEDAKCSIASPSHHSACTPTARLRAPPLLDTPADGLYVGSQRKTPTPGLDRKILTRQPAL